MARYARMGAPVVVRWCGGADRGRWLTAPPQLCLDIIQDMWRPIYTVSSILTSVQSLLADPNPKSPANPEAAHLLVHNPKEYRARVRRCAERSVNGDGCG